MNTNISLAKRLHFTKFGLITKTIDEIIEIIRCGDYILHDSQCGTYSLRDITEIIRKEPDPQKQNELKARFLPVVMFNGIWNGSKISEYSNVTALDFDHIVSDEQLNQTLMVLKSCPFVLAIFRTFKERRYKALVLHDNSDPSRHKEMYEQLIELISLYGIDTSCKDISRKSYLPWDNEIWVNEYCKPFHFIPAAISYPRPNDIHTALIHSKGKQKSPQSIINILNASWRKNHPEYWQKGQRANSIFICACQFCEYGVPQEMAEAYFLNGGWIADDFTSDEVVKHVCGAYSYNQTRYGSKPFI